MPLGPFLRRLLTVSLVVVVMVLMPVLLGTVPVHASGGSLIWAKSSNPSTDNDFAYGVAVDSSGLYVVGFDDVAGNYRWRIEKRSLTTGGVIWAVASNPSTSYDEAYGVAVDSSG
jgi:hypothetical protein